MKNSRFFSIMFAVVFLMLASLACYFGTPPQPPPTAAPPINIPPTVEQPTELLPPTAVEPSPVPDVPTVAPQTGEFDKLLNEFADKGYVNSTEGETTPIDPFKEEWAQLNYYQWWTLDLDASDLVFSGHFSGPLPVPHPTCPAAESFLDCRIMTTTMLSFLTRVVSPS